MRILIRPRWPVLALLLLAPAIPELLTGSTPITPLVLDPVRFAVSFLLEIGLYGTGALLIREFAARAQKGWASILLLGAAYGIAEEGFAVHTFFQTAGSPVGVLGSYGHAFGVDWLWALGLTVFHATYSIALPILLTQLAFPEGKGSPWFDGGSIVAVAAIYVAVVAAFAILVGHGPSPPALAFFLAVGAALVALAAALPGDALKSRPGPRRIGRVGLALAGSLEWDAWIAVLIVASARAVPAIAAGIALALAELAALRLVVDRVGSDDLDRSKLWFATGMLGPLFVWDGAFESRIPGILGVAAVFAVLLVWLARRIDRRDPARLRPTPPSPGPEP